MSTCNRLHLQTHGSQPIMMSNNLPDHWGQECLHKLWTSSSPTLKQHITTSRLDHKFHASSLAGLQTDSWATSPWTVNSVVPIPSLYVHGIAKVGNPKHDSQDGLEPRVLAFECTDAPPRPFPSDADIQQEVDNENGLPIFQVPIMQIIVNFL